MKKCQQFRFCIVLRFNFLLHIWCVCVYVCAYHGGRQRIHFRLVFSFHRADPGTELRSSGMVAGILPTESP